MRPIFRQWWREYSIVYGLPRAVPQAIYYWDGFEHVDPVKEARAQETRLRSLTTTLAAEYAKQGKDWEEELTQIAREREKMRELGLEFGDITPDLEPEETN
jgi:capsid protein